MARILIIGLGNPIVSDDAVGLRVCGLLAERLAQRKDVECRLDYWGGLRLMEHMVGFEQVIVVDAIQTGAAPGSLHELDIFGIPTQKSCSVHDLNLATALQLGRQAGLALPRDEGIRLLGIEVEDVIHFSETLTPAVEAALQPAIERVMHWLEAPIPEAVP